MASAAVASAHSSKQLSCVCCTHKPKVPLLWHPLHTVTGIAAQHAGSACGQPCQQRGHIKQAFPQQNAVQVVPIARTRAVAAAKALPPKSMPTERHDCSGHKSLNADDTAQCQPGHGDQADLAGAIAATSELTETAVGERKNTCALTDAGPFTCSSLHLQMICCMLTGLKPTSAAKQNVQVTLVTPTFLRMIWQRWRCTDVRSTAVAICVHVLTHLPQCDQSCPMLQHHLRMIGC